MQLPRSACQTAPDALVGTLHISHSHSCKHSSTRFIRWIQVCVTRLYTLVDNWLTFCPPTSKKKNLRISFWLAECSTFLVNHLFNSDLRHAEQKACSHLVWGCSLKMAARGSTIFFSRGLNHMDWQTKTVSSESQRSCRCGLSVFTLRRAQCYPLFFFLSGMLWWWTQTSALHISGHDWRGKNVVGRNVRQTIAPRFRVPETLLLINQPLQAVPDQRPHDNKCWSPQSALKYRKVKD